MAVDAAIYMCTIATLYIVHVHGWGGPWESRGVEVDGIFNIVHQCKALYVILKFL
jgi:hypothetical protein